MKKITEKKDVEKSIIIPFYIILGISIIIPIILFIIYFQNQSISYENSSWSELGGYFGGILGPIIALANLIIFVYLTKIAKEFQNVENEKQRNFKRKFLVADLQNDLIKNITDILYSALSKMENIIRKREKYEKEREKKEKEYEYNQIRVELIKIQFLIYRFTTTNDDIFPNIYTTDLGESIQKAIDQINTGEIIKVVLTEYEKQTSIFIKQLRTKMIETLDN